jgi:hypothetical protein
VCAYDIDGVRKFIALRVIRRFQQLPIFLQARPLVVMDERVFCRSGDLSGGPRELKVAKKGSCGGVKASAYEGHHINRN